MCEKAENYRYKLSRFLGRQIILECSDFEMGKTKTGLLCLLLRNPTVTKIKYTVTPKNMTLSHIWVIVPKESDFLKYFMFVRKLRIEGRVFEYLYKDETSQAGVRASRITVAKYRKDITKRFGGHVTVKDLETIARETDRRQKRVHVSQ